MSTQPIDKGAVKFELVFNNTNARYWIDPPIGWDKMPLEIKREGIYARYILFGEENEIEFNPRQVKQGHQFKKLLDYHSLYGTESSIELLIYVDDQVFMRAELDFPSVITDGLTYFKCKLLVSDFRKSINELEDTKINIYGSESLKGNYNSPAETSNVTLRPKKIREISKHVLGDKEFKPVTTDYVKVFGANHQNVGQTLTMGNPFGALTTTGNEDGESYFVELDQQYVNTGPGNSVPTTYTTGNLSIIQNFKFPAETAAIIKVENIHIKVEGQNINNSNTRIILQAAVIKYDNADFENVVEKYYITLKDVISKQVIINETIEVIFPEYSRVIYEFRVYINGRVSTPEEKVTIYAGGNITTETIGIYPASKSIMTRLIHAGQKILSNYTENQIYITAPRFFEGGEFWWYFITSGYFIRGFTDSSFDLSFKEWKEFIQSAFNCDVQINGDNVFIGRHEDFYENKEIAAFMFKPSIDSYEISFNNDLIVNGINIGFESFEDDKNDTMDAFHTDSKWYVPKKYKGVLDIKIPFTADGYSIEYARREGIEAEPTTSKTKDDDVYIVDVFDNRIWIPWPINSYFTIRQNRQNQGFSIVQNIFSPESIYNLRLSLKRLLLDHYSTRISEIGSSLDNGVPTNATEFAKNTFFKSNGELYTEAETSLHTYNGGVKDNGTITGGQLNQPIIGREIYSFVLSERMKFNTLINLYNKVINERGYIRFYSDEKEIKIHAFEMKYDWLKEELTIKGEKRYAI